MFGDGRARYELVEGPKRSHHHQLACTDCNRVVDDTDFMDEEVELLRDPEINQIKAKSKHKSKQNFPLDKNFC
ncbi:MAG: transcriptional repressor [Candidatus Omnitrophica bacterium]|nr:transcriptional repressor [Candidatus Omnitrophota bacterium]